MVDYLNLIPLAAIVFGAGALYEKFRSMGKDLKSLKENDINSIKNDIESIKNDVGNMGETRTIHDQLIKSQQAAFSVYVEAFASLIATLSKSNAIKKEDLISILSKTSADSMNKTLQSIAGGTGNPVSAEEAERLRQYVERARANLNFTQWEAQDFYNLSQRVSQDRSQDEGAWGILLLAAFIFALYVLSKKS
jgi:hypothetical protein